jgi:anti-sigma-K factor RskA
VAAKVRDSLAVLPLVRKEARQQGIAAGRYKLAADAAFESYLKQVSATGNVQLALREQKVETARYEVNAKKWKDKAQRRGFWNWLAAVAVAVVAVGSVTR